MPKTFVINDRVIGTINTNRGLIGIVTGVINEQNKTSYQVHCENGHAAVVSNHAIDKHNGPPPLQPQNDDNSIPEAHENDSIPSQSINSSNGDNESDPDTPPDSVSKPHVCCFYFLTHSFLFRSLQCRTKKSIMEKKKKAMTIFSTKL